MSNTTIVNPPAIISNPIFTTKQYDVIDQANRVILNNQFAALIGPPGVNKSFMSMKLIPEQFLSGQYMGYKGNNWRIVSFGLSDAPLEDLAQALATPGALFKEKEADSYIYNSIKELLAAPNGLFKIYEKARIAAEEEFNLLLVIDDFEDLFRYQALSNEEGVITDFINIVMRAVRDSKIPIYLIINMEEDYILEAAKYRGLTDVLNTGKIPIIPISIEEITTQLPQLLQADNIAYSGTFLNALKTAIENNDRPYSLFFRLNFLLKKIFHDPQYNFESLEAYNTLGGLDACVDQATEAIYKSLSLEQQALCKQLFKLIVDKKGKGLARKPILFSEALLMLQQQNSSAITGQDINAIIEAFQKDDLNFFNRSITNEQSIIDFSDNILFREWTSLRRWVEEDDFNLNIYQRLLDEALLYKDANGSGSLYQHQKLEATMSWYKSQKPTAAWASRYHPVDLPEEAWAKSYSNTFEIAIAFLKQSEQHYLQEIAKVENERQAQLRVLRHKSWIAGIFALVAIGFGIWAFYSNRQTQKAAKKIELLGILDDLGTAKVLRSDQKTKINALKNLIANEEIAEEARLYEALVAHQILTIENQNLNESAKQSLASIHTCYNAIRNGDSKQLEASTANLLNLYDKEKSAKGAVNPFIFTAMIQHWETLLNQKKQYNYIKNNISSLYDISSNPGVSEEFAYGDGNGDIQVCKTDFTKNNCFNLKGGYALRSLFYSQDGRYLFAGNLGGRLDRWTLEKKTNSTLSHAQNVKLSHKIYKELSEPILFLTTATDLKKDFLLVGTLQHLYLMNAATGKVYSKITSKGEITGLSIHPKGDYLFYSTPSASYLHRIVNQTKIKKNPILQIEHKKVIITASIINNNQANAKLVLGTDSGDLWYTDIEKNLVPYAEDRKTTSLQTLAAKGLIEGPDKKHTGAITGLVFNPYSESSQLASASIDGSVRLTDISENSGKNDIVFVGNDRDIWTVDFKNENEVIVGENRSIRIWISDKEKLADSLGELIKK